MSRPKDMPTGWNDPFSDNYVGEDIIQSVELAECEIALKELCRSEKILYEVLCERRRVIEKEGYSIENDDEYAAGVLASSGAAYAYNAAEIHLHSLTKQSSLTPDEAAGWGWKLPRVYWKPKDPRRNLIRAMQLILAEIEKMDREEERKNEGEDF